jgi:phenylpropionate dioxygenase-like ring-hydroxylating dioxygenase large terminal subunit
MTARGPMEEKTLSQAGGRRRLLSRPVPAEGDGGVFSQSWFPVCMARELPESGVLGAPFLDGRVVVFRGESGAAQVLSAYCPHLGADLAVGKVVGDTLRCAFHHWQYDRQGICVKTGAGDPPPPDACLFKFPTVERYGIIWAFNGERPHFEIPSFPYPDDELIFKIEVQEGLLNVDPWVVCCNTPDINHIRVVHGISFDEEPNENIEWTDHSMLYDFKGRHSNGMPIVFRVGIYGTTIFYQSSVVDGRWYGYIAPFGMPVPGKTRAYYVLAVRRSEHDDASAQAALSFAMTLQTQVLTEDIPIMDTIHFRPGTLTRSDKALARFFEYLRAFPRSHPSAEFIR